MSDLLQTYEPRSTSHHDDTAVVLQCRVLLELFAARRMEALRENPDPVPLVRLKLHVD
jgi:hypothetical protein